MSRFLYEITDLEHRYGQTLALKIERLTIKSGRIIGLVGPNGSGKSTLLKILALVERPTQGRVIINGREAEPASAAQRRQVTLLLQEPYLLQRSVFENVAYGLKVRGERTDLRRLVHQALNWVGLEPAAFARRPWSDLSGGEAQRVALAARLILRPKVLLLDEPTASLDLASAALIKDAALKAQRDWGATLVIASHDLAWLYDVSNEVLDLFGGRLVRGGRLTFLPGPWRVVSQDSVQTTLPDGQTIIAARPHSQKSTAAVASADISLLASPPARDSKTNLLKGVVVRLTWKRLHETVIMDISLAGLSFSVTLDQAKSDLPDFRPGQEVWLTFSDQAVRWD